MRRTLTALGLAALVGTGATVGLAAPAHADGYVLYKTFGWPDACSSAGYAGQQSGQWKYYYCDIVSYPTYDAPGLVYLYVSY